MTHKVYVVTDLGPGDGGKGGVVHKISHMTRAHTIIKRGGAQGSHGVHTSKGEKFAFSQWGCGTFDGIPTHLSEQMIISPEGLLNEATHLRYLHGIDKAFSLLTVDERALCTTPFHGIASRLKEMARGGKPRGTVGTGAGEAYRMYQHYPDLAIIAHDLKRPGLRERLATIRQQVQLELQSVVEGQFMADDLTERQQEIDLLFDDKFLQYVVERFDELARQVNIVSSDYLGEVILAQEGVAVVETSHGVLTDRLVGFHPHTSAIRTLPSFTHGMLKNAGYDDQVVNIGVTRAYAVRHGAGPMPTADPDMTDRLLPGSAKDDNRYQGKVRVGPLDLVLLRYAIEACGGQDAFNGLAVTWFDQIQQNESWDICRGYRTDSRGSTFFTPTGEIRIESDTAPSVEYQRSLGRRLLSCVPEVTSMSIDVAASKDELFDICAATMQAAVNVPVRMVSFGPTELDKICK